MNKHDIEMLKANWELKRELLKNWQYKESMDISSSCYVDFGTCGISVWKYRKGKWNRKIINYWRELNFEQFMEKFNNQEWEIV